MNARWTAAALSVALAGCGGARGPALAGPTREVALALDLFNEAKDRPKQLTASFAAGATPPAADLKRYPTLSYGLTKGAPPAVTGDAATVQVMVYDEKAGGAELGAVEWEFVKEGGVWKIKRAPLP